MNQPVFNKLKFDQSALSWKIVGVTRNTIELSWEKRAGIVEYLLTSTGDNSGEVIYQGPGTTFTIDSLKSNTRYTYFLGGRTADGKRLTPTLVVGKTEVRGVPEKPTHLREHFKTTDSVILVWDDGEVDGGVPRYLVKRDGATLEVVEDTAIWDTTPQEGRDHVYCVTTVDDEFYESEPICIEVSFDDITAPTNPTNMHVEEIQVRVRWTPVYDSSGRVTYHLDLGLGKPVGTTAEPWYLFTGLQSGKPYEMGVTAFDESGNQSERVVIHYPAQGIPPQRK
ncbi:Fibronectin type III domain protein [compost metagenome]